MRLLRASRHQGNSADYVRFAGAKVAGAQVKKVSPPSSSRVPRHGGAVWSDTHFQMNLESIEASCVEFARCCTHGTALRSRESCPLSGSRTDIESGPQPLLRDLIYSSWGWKWVCVFIWKHVGQ